LWVHGYLVFIRHNDFRTRFLAITQSLSPKIFLSDTFYSCGASSQAAAALARYIDFEHHAVDLEILLPAGVGIHKITLCWQKAPSEHFLLEDKNRILNLWDIGPDDGRIQNNSGIPIFPVNLIDVPFNQPEPGDVVGHEQGHEWFQDVVIADGLKRFG